MTVPYDPRDDWSHDDKITDQEVNINIGLIDALTALRDVEQHIPHDAHGMRSDLAPMIKEIGTMLDWVSVHRGWVNAPAQRDGFRPPTR